MQNIYINAHHATSTNGHILAIVPLRKEKDDTPGWMTPDAVKPGRKIMPKGTHATNITQNGHQILLDQTTMARPNGETSPPKLFPILRQGHSNRCFKVGINASHLKDLFDAIGAEKVVLESGEPDSAVLVKPGHGSNGEVGLIMPVRIK